MATYSETIAAIAEAARSRENALPLLAECCRSRFFFHEQPTDRVCLFFHGFTSGPFQFEPMGTALFKAGYNVLVPLMPGHGQAGNWNRDQPPPLPTEIETYQKFALHWLEQAQALGQQVIVGGLSGGGTIAAWLAFQQSRTIDRAVLFAPYFSSSSRLVDLFVRNSSSYFEWFSAEVAAKFPARGYNGFAVPALRTFLDLGNQVKDLAQHQPSAPLFVISSEADIAVDRADHRTLFEAALANQPVSWYHCFNRVLEVPHNMMTTLEGNRWQDLLYVMTKAFVESNLTWAEVEEIAYRMTEGKTFDQVVQELGLQAKCSPDMPAMITMVDKREIADRRNPCSVVTA